MTTEDRQREQLRLLLHVTRRLQLIAIIAMACDLAFGIGYAIATDVPPAETTVMVATFGVALAAWIAMVLAEAKALRDLRRLS